MRIILLALISTAALIGTHVNAGIVTNLSTGSSPSGALIDVGQADDNWVVLSAPSGVPVGSAATVVAPARSFFVTDEPYARWISPTTATNSDASAGAYTYRHTFELAGMDAGRVLIQGHYAADNRLLQIFVNGITAFVGPFASGAGCSPGGCEEFRQFSDFLIDDQTLFNTGINTFDVVVENQSSSTNPTAFLMHAAVTQNHVPAPATLALLCIGLVGLAASRRPRKFISA